MILAYFIILKGDYKILAKFIYKDETESGLLNQLGERVQTLGEAVQYLDFELKNDTQNLKNKKILVKYFNKNKLLFVNSE